jgi:hypothetical protein
MGPARFILHPENSDWLPEVFELSELGRVEIKQLSKTQIEVKSLTRKGEKTQKKYNLSSLEGQEIPAGFMGVMLAFRQTIPHAVNATKYSPSRIQYGDKAPSSAIKVNGMWMAEGETVAVPINGSRRQLFYYRKRLSLPFYVSLNRFTIEHYEGTQSPKSFSSNVYIFDAALSGSSGTAAQVGPIEISMNEPLDYKGFTFYQSSYLPAQPRPTTSIFTVNQDPGRFLKYFGSILLVGGSILLFAVKHLKDTWLGPRLAKWLT